LFGRRPNKFHQVCTRNQEKSRFRNLSFRYQNFPATSDSHSEVCKKLSRVSGWCFRAVSPDPRSWHLGSIPLDELGRTRSESDRAAGVSTSTDRLQRGVPWEGRPSRPLVPGWAPPAGKLNGSGGAKEPTVHRACLQDANIRECAKSSMNLLPASPPLRGRRQTPQRDEAAREKGSLRFRREPPSPQRLASRQRSLRNGPNAWHHASVVRVRVLGIGPVFRVLSCPEPTCFVVCLS